MCRCLPHIYFISFLKEIKAEQLTIDNNNKGYKSNLISTFSVLCSRLTKKFKDILSQSPNQRDIQIINKQKNNQPHKIRKKLRDELHYNRTRGCMAFLLYL